LGSIFDFWIGHAPESLPFSFFISVGIINFVTAPVVRVVMGFLLALFC